MRQRGQFGIILVVILVVLVLAMIGLFSVCSGDDDDNSLGRVQLVSHERARCYDDGDCYDEGYNSGGDYSGHDRNRSRGRNRGAFSPGPFEDSPVDAFNGNTICLPGSTCTPDDRDRRDDQPPPDEEPER